jgi:O-antigen ligase
LFGFFYFWNMEIQNKKTNFIDKAYILFLIALPFVFSNLIIEPYLLPRQLYITFFIVIISTRIIYSKKKISIISYYSPISICVFGVLLFSIFSLYQSKVISESHEVFSKNLILFIFMLITIILLTNNLLRIKNIVIGIVSLNIIVIVSTFFQFYKNYFLHGKLFMGVDSVAAEFGNKNLLSSIVFLCFPFLFIGINLSKKTKYTSLFGILASTSILIVLRTRAVIIALIVFYLILIFSYLNKNHKIKKHFLLGFGIALSILITIIYKMFFENKIQNLHSSPIRHQQYLFRLFSSDTFQSRIQFWKNSLEMFLENPFFGVGLGNWQVYFPKYGLNGLLDLNIIKSQSTCQRPHNDFLWILDEIGIFGFLFFCAIFIILIYQAVYLIKNHIDKSEKWNYVYLLSGLIGYLLISFFDFPLERIEHQILLTLLISIIVSEYTNFKSIKTYQISKLKILVIVLPIVFYSSIITIYQIIGQYHTVNIYHAKEKKNWSLVINEANLAKNYFYKLDTYSIPIDWYKGYALFSENKVQQSLNEFINAYKLNPYNIHVINNLASCYGKLGFHKSAIQLYKKALKISHNFEEAEINLAGVYYNIKDYDNAFTTIDKCNPETKNKNYKLFLAPILQKKLMLIFLKSNLSYKNQMFTPKKLLQLYIDSKRKNITFEEYVIKSLTT